MSTSTAPLRVVCTNCSTKFHVSEQLVRGRQVKFRCRRCRSPIDVDGTALSASQVSQVSLFPRPSENDPPDNLPHQPGLDAPVDERRARGAFDCECQPGLFEPPAAKLDVGRNHERAASSAAHEGPPDRQFFPPPPRESVDPFALRPPAPTAIFAPPDLLSTVTLRVTKLQGYSDAPTELPRVEVPLDPTRHIGRVFFLAALFAAAGWTAWTFMGASPNATRTPQGGVAARMQADDFQGVTAEPLKQAKSGTSPSTTTILPTAAPVSSVAPASPAPQVLVPGAAAPAKVVAPPAKVAGQAKVERDEAAEDPAIEALRKSPTKASRGARQAAADPAPVPTQATAANGAAIDGEPSTGGGPADEFDTTLARASLEEAGRRAGECRTIDTPAGGARIAVTFAPTGRVTSAVIEAGPFAGTPAGDASFPSSAPLTSLRSRAKA